MYILDETKRIYKIDNRELNEKLALSQKEKIIEIRRPDVGIIDEWEIITLEIYKKSD